jgi:hypothetical protein
MNSATLPLLFFVFFGLIAAMIMVVAWKKRKQRAADLQSVADTLGFHYAGNDASRAPQVSTALFRRGSSRRFRNVMHGTQGNYQVSVFDYSYTVSGGENSSTYTQTVAAIVQDRPLPGFELRPEGFLDRIAEAFVHRDLDFETHPEFSKRYVLRGDDETAIRALFTPALLSYFEMVPPEKKWHIETSGSTLLAYQAKVTVSPQEIRTFLDDACALANALLASFGRSASSWHA